MPSVIGVCASSACARYRNALRGDAIAQLIRAFESQHFFDRGLDELRSREQRRLLIRMLVKRHKPVADQVGGRLVSGVEKKDAVVHQLPRAQALALILSLNETRQHIVLGITGPNAPLGDDRVEARDEFIDGFIAACCNLVS